MAERDWRRAGIRRMTPAQKRKYQRIQKRRAERQAERAKKNAAPVAQWKRNPNPAPKGMTPTQESAFDQMEQFLGEYGLTDLGGFVKDLILDGTNDAATLQLELQATAQWKRRFAGNEALKAKGLGVLSPAEYLSMERSYAQIMSNYGLPSGFYDDPQDYANLIGKNVSVNELQTRVAAYADLAGREDKETRDQLASIGITQGDLLAHLMDPERAAPILQRQVQAVKIGAAARRAGVVPNNGSLNDLAARGVTEQEAAQGFGLIAGSLNEANTLAGAYGEDYGADDLQAEVFDNSAVAARKRKRLASQERAAFSGSAGVGRLTQNNSGSY